MHNFSIVHNTIRKDMRWKLTTQPTNQPPNQPTDPGAARDDHSLPAPSGSGRNGRLKALQDVGKKLEGKKHDIFLIFAYIYMDYTGAKWNNNLMTSIFWLVNLSVDCFCYFCCCLLSFSAFFSNSFRFLVFLLVVLPLFHSPSLSLLLSCFGFMCARRSEIKRSLITTLHLVF